MSAMPLLAFGLPGYQEMLVILVIGLLIFGRRLPEVGRAVGKTVSELRKGMQNLKDQIDSDEEFREVKSTLHDFKSAVEAPPELTDLRDMTDLSHVDPARLFDDLTDENAATPGPKTTQISEAPAKSAIEEAAEKQSSSG